MMKSDFTCRERCGACCIVPSISSFIPGMPNGKPGGIPCIHLTDDMRCGIFDHASRPLVCGGFKAERLVCGNNRSEAAQILSELEGIDLRLNIL
ncbi:MAG TPA: YkgJ family cysteine cluster protein [Bacteroidales bacterium]|nr:YkgJ family cysteine cluster protein [Bacteroidales bacterium]